jgi:uroporphyrinogen decarboxylase
MRQAGRYMPEYQAVRSRADFMRLCREPELSAEVSWLPRTILGVDALIIFNDILIPIDEMGGAVVFGERGPEITRPLRTESDLSGWFAAVDYTAPGAEPIVCESIRRLRGEAGPDIPIFGFAGAPFTMAAYAIEGKMSKSLNVIKRMRFEAPELLHRALERLTTTISSYLVAQVQGGGADAVQLFDTWAGELTRDDYEEFALRYARRAIEEVRKACPGVPVQYFARDAAHMLDLAASAGADVLSIDWRVRLADARQRLSMFGDSPPTLQGNLDPVVLDAGPEQVARHFHRTLEDFDPFVGYIANLGHGILPTARVASAQALVAAVKALECPGTPVPDEVVAEIAAKRGQGGTR